MRLSHVLCVGFVRCEQIIKNVNIPACRNCVYYKPNIYNIDFTSTFNRCSKFGDKDIVTNKISLDFADYCRKDESKCGFEGKYFEEEKNIKMKIIKHKILNVNVAPIITFLLLIVGANY